MSAVTIRNLPDETHRALKKRAERHGRSTEAEIRAILEAATRPPSRLRLGSALQAEVLALGLTNRDIELLTAPEKQPAQPLEF